MSLLQQALRVEQDADHRVRLAGADVELNGRKLLVTRAFPLDDIRIRKDGTGRTVDAYALVFNSPAEIKDQDGHYMEQNDPRCLARSLDHRRDKIFCLYNHGKTLGGTPSDTWSVPIGKPLEMRTDGRGWFTSTLYNKDPEADRILEAIKSGSLRGMSYTGVFVRSSPELKGAWSRYGPDADGQLPLVTRLEIAPIEYGPTPIPAFDEAQVVGVRARETATVTRDGVVDAAAMPPHHTPVTDVNWDVKGELGKLKPPMSWDDMQGMFGLIDKDASGGRNEYEVSSGHLPHHMVGPDGKPGPANLQAVRTALDQVNGQEGYEIAGFTTNDKRKAIAHLNVHLEDHHGFQPPINEPPAGQAPVGSSGRQPEEGVVRNEEEAMTLSDEDAEALEPALEAGRATATGTGTMHSTEKVDAGEYGDNDEPGRAADGRWDPDDDGDDDSTPEGDTDHDHWSADGKQLKPVPGKPLPAGRDDGSWDTGRVWAAGAESEDPAGFYAAVCAGRRAGSGKTQSAWALPHHYEPGGPANEDAVRIALGFLAQSRDRNAPLPVRGLINEQAARAHLLAHEAAFRAKAKTPAPAAGDASWDDDDDDTPAPRAGDAPGNGKKPYGNVTYADPKNGKYPIDTPAHIHAAWAYINKPKNAAVYPLNGVSLGSVKAKIKAAMKRIGAQVSEDAGSGGKKASSSSGRHPSADALGTGSPQADPQQHSVSNSRNGSKAMTEHAMERMTIDERKTRQQEVRHRLSEIDSEYMGAELPSETRSEWAALQQELVIHDRAIRDAEQRAQYLRQIAENDPPGVMEGVDNGMTGYSNTYTPPSLPPGFRPSGDSGRNSTMFYNPVRGADIWDTAAIRNKSRSYDDMKTLYREHAYRAIEVSHYDTPFKSQEDCQNAVSKLLSRIDDEKGSLAERILRTGSPMYERAFGKLMGTLSTGALTTEESRALALSTDSAGGYAVPFQLDPTVILTSNGAVNPLRQMSRIEQITGKEWDGVTSAGVVVNRVAEGTEAGTTSGSTDAVFVQPNVRTTRVQGFVPFNIELDVSWGALRSQMTNLLMDAKDVEEATSFLLGNGTAPNANGVVQTLGTASVVNTAGTATLAISDLYNLENNMPPRFRQQSAYLASKTTYNRFRQLFQAQASAAFDSWVRPSAGTPATFNGYPAYEASQMANTITSTSRVLLQGDFNQFLIVDRVGMGIELIPHLFGANQRYPVGQRGILAIWFNNSQILVQNAFRILTTT